MLVVVELDIESKNGSTANELPSGREVLEYVMERLQLSTRQEDIDWWVQSVRLGSIT